MADLCNRCTTCQAHTPAPAVDTTALSRGSLPVVAFAIIAFAPIAAAQPATVSREQIIEAMRSNSRLEGELVPEAKDGLTVEQYMRQLKLEQNAGQIVPASIEVATREDAQAVLKGLSATFRYADQQLNESLLRKRLADTVVDLRATSLITVPHGDTRKAIVSSLDTLVRRVEQAFADHYGKGLDPAGLSAQLSAFRDAMVGKVDNRKVYAMKRPLPPEQINEAVEAIAKRLADSAPNREQLLADPRGDDPARIQQLIVDRALLKLAAAVNDGTIAEELADITADDILPGYREISRQYATRKAEVFRQAVDRRVTRRTQDATLRALQYETVTDDFEQHIDERIALGQLEMGVDQNPAAASPESPHETVARPPRPTPPTDQTAQRNVNPLHVAGAIAALVVGLVCILKLRRTGDSANTEAEL